MLGRAKVGVVALAGSGGSGERVLWVGALRSCASPANGGPYPEAISARRAPLK